MKFNSGYTFNQLNINIMKKMDSSEQALVKARAKAFDFLLFLG
ncbi:hypothetical protein JCM16418A_11420 [Paenibacillus pini]